MSASTPAPSARSNPTILGVGAALPTQLVTNADLVARLDTSDEWIVRRTGIRERRFLEPGQPLVELAADACLEALADAGLAAAEVDHVIVATFTAGPPDARPRAGARRADRRRPAPASSTSTPPAPAGSTASTTPPR